MGFDIHLYVEVRDRDAWQLIGDEGDYYNGRNYSLFGILAGVRKDHFNSISDPRGLPMDASSEASEVLRDFGDGHTPSWLGVQEIMDFDWTQVATMRGSVNAVELWKWSRYDRSEGEGPRSYSGGTSGPNVEYLDERDLLGRIEELLAANPDVRQWNMMEALIEKTLGNYYCYVTWDVPYFKTCRNFLSDCLPKLWRLGKPNDVRIVFWFDN